MSDPVTNVEIEDVLSSIRRLVSNEQRQEHPAKSDRDDAVERLVLTPSLRISEDDDHGLEQDSTTDTPMDHATGGVFRSRQPRQEDRESDNQESAHKGDAPDEGSSETDSDDMEKEDTAVSAFSESDQDDVKPESSEDARKADGDHEDDRHEDDSDNRDSHADMRVHDAQQDQDVPQDDDAGHLANDVEVEDDRVETPGRSPFEQRVAGLEAVVASRNEQWEPDGQSDDAYAGGPVEPLQWDAATEEDEPTDQTAPEPVQNRADPFVELSPSDEDDDARPAKSEESLHESTSQIGSDFLDDDSFPDEGETFLDEDALRDLVSEIVRQELQGALGERITRNVRKLVRREIHRALTSQQFD